MTLDPNCAEFQSWVSDLLDGDVPAAEAARLEAHAGQCAQCGPLLAGLRGCLRDCADERLFALPEPARQRLHRRLAAALAEPPPRRWPWTWSRPWARSWPYPSAAAAVVLFLLLVGGVTRWRAHAVTTYGWLMDPHCLAMARSNPEKHDRDCLLRCAKYGYGVIDAKGNFVAFDARGNQSAKAALESTHQVDHLWVKVTGHATGQTLQVDELTLEPADIP